MSRLHTTPNFAIEWFSGADSSGLYVFENAPSHYVRGPQFFIDLELIPGFIQMLREAQEPITLFTRIKKDHQIVHMNRPQVPFVPVFHRVPKKDGGVWGEAYYTPMGQVEVERLRELADALELACSYENVLHLEEHNTSEGYVILDGNYLENGRWANAFGFLAKDVLPLSESIERMPARLEQVAKQRITPLPTYESFGSGRFALKTARGKHQCYRSVHSRCIAGYWIQPEESYLEHRHGRDIDRYHLKCAFRSGIIPVNWLNPHFEQYHRLVELGFEKWIATEQAKRIDYSWDNYHISFEVQEIRDFIEMLKEGYELDRFEKRDWREHLRDVPIDIEPYRTARRLVGLTDP